jgi:oligoribonuclease (3'-5' exoribonuclease)
VATHDATPAYIAIDTETTGLNTGPVADGGDLLLEVAVVLLAGDLSVIDHVSALTLPAWFSDGEDFDALDDLVDGCNDTVRTMHRDNGLWADLEAGLNAGTVLTPAALDTQISAMLAARGVHSAAQLPLLGSSPNLDRGMVARDLPRTGACLHYHTVDASTLKELLVRSGGEDAAVNAALDDAAVAAADEVASLTGTDAGQVKHRALFDILVSAAQIPAFSRLLGAPDLFA